jgi:hypothetical protein
MLDPKTYVVSEQTEFSTGFSDKLKDISLATVISLTVLFSPCYLFLSSSIFVYFPMLVGIPQNSAFLSGLDSIWGEIYVRQGQSVTLFQAMSKFQKCPDFKLTLLFPSLCYFSFRTILLLFSTSAPPPVDLWQMRPFFYR